MSQFKFFTYRTGESLGSNASREDLLNTVDNNAIIYSNGFIKPGCGNGHGFNGNNVNGKLDGHAWWSNPNYGQTNQNESDISKRTQYRGSNSWETAMDWWLSTTTNKFRMSRVFDVCDINLANKSEDEALDPTKIKGCFYEHVNGLYLIFNNRDCVTKNGSTSFVEKLGLIYVYKSSGTWRKAILGCTQKVCGPTLNASSGTGMKEKIYGYKLNDSWSKYVSDHDFRFAGYRVQLCMIRTGTGTTSQYLQSGFTGLLPMINIGYPYDFYNSRDLILRSATTISDADRYSIII